ncbi:MAG: hypothetical protein ACRCZO_12535 [Cetobacterium sp.]
MIALSLLRMWQPKALPNLKFISQTGKLYENPVKQLEIVIVSITEYGHFGIGKSEV